MREQETKGILAYKVGKALNTISNELELYTKTQHELFDKYCVKDENNNIKIVNNNVQIIPDKINEYNQEINKINKLEIELNIPALTLEELDNFTITPQQAINLQWWIK